MTITRALPFADYLARPGVNFSTLKHMAVSPLHYRRARDAEHTDTDALRVGRAVHALTLTPEAADVVVFDGKVRRGKSWDEFAATFAGKTILTPAQHAAAAKMRGAVCSHPVARRMLLAENGDPEVTVEWTDAETGLACKCRVDWFSRGDVIELKTCRASHPGTFPSAFARYRYHAQLAFYLDGIESVTGPSEVRADAYVIAVEKTAPHDVCVYSIPDDAIEAGRRLVRGWLRQVAECEASGRWPGAGGDAEVPLVLPDWAISEGLEDPDMSGIGSEEDGNE